MRIPAVAFAALLSAALLSVAGCSNSASSPHAASRRETASSPNGTVKGNGSSPDAIIVLEPKAPPTPSAQANPPVMDQAGLTFSPEMLFVRTGQPVEFRNSDDTLHNVHVGNIDTREPAFNVAIPTGEKYTYSFQKDGFYHVGCDIHPAMAAEIFATSSPFATLAETDGSFSFADVPPGAYTVRVFSSRGRWQRDVEVTSGLNQVRVEESF